MTNPDSLTWPQVSDAINTQARVIHALIMRETISRYGDHKLGFLWAVIEPLVMIALVVGMMSLIQNENPGGMPLVLFILTGFVPFFMFRNTMNQLKGAISSNKSLLGFPQVTLFDAIVARALLESAVMLMVFAFLLGMAHLLGYEIRVENPLGVLFVCINLLLIGSGMGFILATLTIIVPSTGQIATIVFGRPLLMASGLFFTAASIPEPFRTWLLYNPMLHLMELCRTYFFYEFDSDYGSWKYVSVWVIGTLTLGMLIHQALRRRAIVGL